MNKYEILYIIRCDIEDDRKTQVVEKYNALAEKLGTLEATDIWGMKKFAYEIDNDRQMGIDDNVVRRMIVKK